MDVFYSGEIMGGDIKIVSISQYDIRITSSVRSPGLVKREWQTVVLIFMHES
jgi:hypothetical protein